MSIAKFVGFVPSIDIGKVLGATVWCGGTYATALVLQEIGVGGWRLILAAIVIQAVLTYLEGHLWAGRISVATAGALMLDCLANAAGIWFLVRRIEDTTIWAMLQQSLGWGDISSTTHLIIALIIALAIAASPEILWKGK